MSAEYLEVHPENPHGRQIHVIVERLRKGAIVAYPTDSCYAFGCHIGDKEAVDKIKRIRALDKHHNMTLVCSDMAQISQYARVDNWQYRMLRHATPGPFTFVLQATLQVPRRLHTGKRKTIGVRVPENNIAQAILAELGEPLLSCTATLPGRDLPFHDAQEISDQLANQLDLIVDGGFSAMDPTTVIDLSAGDAQVLREGKGDLALLGL
ncbi:MAG: L-threonylcarbamoyladenylate synthase [Oceanococcus sp.]